MDKDEIATRARELTDDQLRWVQDDLAVEGCPLCGAEACLEACEALADQIVDHVRELAAGLSKHRRAELIQMRGCTDASPAECDRRMADALVRQRLAAPTSLRGHRHWVMYYPTPLGRAVLRALEEK